jgi:hypothetical protein
LKKGGFIPRCAHTGNLLFSLFRGAVIEFAINSFRWEVSKSP